MTGTLEQYVLSLLLDKDGNRIDTAKKNPDYGDLTLAILMQSTDCIAEGRASSQRGSNPEEIKQQVITELHSETTDHGTPKTTQHLKTAAGAVLLQQIMQGSPLKLSPRGNDVLIETATHYCANPQNRDLLGAISPDSARAGLHALIDKHTYKDTAPEKKQQHSLTETTKWLAQTLKACSNAFDALSVGCPSGVETSSEKPHEEKRPAMRVVPPSPSETDLNKKRDGDFTKAAKERKRLKEEPENTLVR